MLSDHWLMLGFAEPFEMYLPCSYSSALMTVKPKLGSLNPSCSTGGTILHPLAYQSEGFLLNNETEFVKQLGQVVDTTI